MRRFDGIIDTKLDHICGFGDGLATACYPYGDDNTQLKGGFTTSDCTGDKIVVSPLPGVTQPRPPVASSAR